MQLIYYLFNYLYRLEIFFVSQEEPLFYEYNKGVLITL